MGNRRAGAGKSPGKRPRAGNLGDKITSRNVQAGATLGELSRDPSASALRLPIKGLKRALLGCAGWRFNATHSSFNDNSILLAKALNMAYISERPEDKVS